MGVYFLDENFGVHVAQDEKATLKAWEDKEGFFKGKCRAFIEGFRIVPEGESWTRSDGTIFTGLMIAPLADFSMLQAIQSAYEQGKEEAGAEANKRFDEVEAAIVELAATQEGGGL